MVEGEIAQMLNYKKNVAFMLGLWHVGFYSMRQKMLHISRKMIMFKVKKVFDDKTTDPVSVTVSKLG